MDDFIRFDCPACGKRCKAPPNLVGRIIVCRCSHRMRVPQLPGVQPEAQKEFEESLGGTAPAAPIDKSATLIHLQNPSEGADVGWFSAQWPWSSL